MPSAHGKIYWLKLCEGIMGKMDTDGKLQVISVQKLK